jgi:hypothetical protein
MLPISELSALSLSWKQPSAWRQEFLLVSDSGTHGRLAFTSWWKEIAEVEVGAEAFVMQRTGFFRRQVNIRRAGEAELLAVYYPNAWSYGGTLELGSLSYKFSSNFWQTRHEFRRVDGLLVLVLHPRGLLRSTVDLEIPPEALRLPELPLLVALGMVLILLHHHDAAAASAASASS